MVIEYPHENVHSFDEPQSRSILKHAGSFICHLGEFEEKQVCRRRVKDGQNMLCSLRKESALLHGHKLSSNAFLLLIDDDFGTLLCTSFHHADKSRKEFAIFSIGTLLTLQIYCAQSLELSQKRSLS